MGEGPRTPEYRMRFNFEWDPIKAKLNWKKHGVSFEIASTIFRDRHALSIYDIDHSEDEERWITLGIAANGALLVVHHTFAVIDDKTVMIRLISSRKAVRREQDQYVEMRNEKGI
jgi:uncharacterized protein